MTEYIFYIIRTIVIFLSIMLLIRILGKREVGELSIFDLVVLLIIADIGAMGIEKKEMFYVSLLAFFVLLCLQKLFALLLLKNSFLRNFIDGMPKVMIKNGQIAYKALKKEKYNMDDLVMQLRIGGILDINEVILAILETSGDLTVFRKTDYKELVLPIILSGNIDKDFLDELNIDKNTVLKMLKKYNLKLEDVMYCLSNGKDLISLKTTQMVNQKNRT